MDCIFNFRKNATSVGRKVILPVLHLPRKPSTDRTMDISPIVIKLIESNSAANPKRNIKNDFFPGVCKSHGNE